MASFPIYRTIFQISAHRCKHLGAASLLRTRLVAPRTRFPATIARQMSVNQTSQSSYDKNHELYDLVRPDFQPEAVESLCKDLKLPLTRPKVAELAVGTGKFTKAIADKDWDLTAVEPSTGMIESFQKNFPNVKIIEGSSYHLPFETGSVDAVIIAQAYHWFADHKSVQELARVLKPGTGKLAMVWNYENIGKLPETAWQKRCCEYVWSYDLGVPQYRRMEWPASFENQSVFDMPYQERFFQWTRKFDREELWRYWQSRSYITALSEEKQQKVHDDLMRILDESVESKDLDDNGLMTGLFGVHTTVVNRNETTV